MVVLILYLPHTHAKGGHMTTAFPNILKMMAGYINMDAFEITGSKDRGGQVRYFTTRVSPKTMKLLMIELDSFERLHSDDLTDQFEEAFDFGAHIPDAKAFFDLVRHEVNVALAERGDTPLLIPTVINPEPFKGTVKHGIVPNKLLQRFVEAQTKLLKLTGSPVERTAIGVLPPDWRAVDRNDAPTVKIVRTWDEVFSSASLTKGAVSYSALSHILEAELLRLASNTPSNKRNTEEYAILLEQLLELKGVKVEKREHKSATHAFNLSVDDFIQMQESKLTR